MLARVWHTTVMKISELIAHLEKLQSAHGDLPVLLATSFDDEFQWDDIDEETVEARAGSKAAADKHNIPYDPYSYSGIMRLPDNGAYITIG